MKRSQPIKAAMALGMIVVGCTRGNIDTQNSRSVRFVSADSEPPAKSASSQEIAEKRREYRDALRQIDEMLEAKRQLGELDPFSFFKAKRDLLEAELMVEDTQEEKEATLAKMLEQAKQLEDAARQRVENGTANRSEHLLSTTMRLDIELKLLETRNSASTSSSTKRSP